MPERADISTNVNFTCRVKLTELGRRILREKDEALKRSFPSITVGSCVEHDGNYRTQIWSLMQDFGSHMYCGGEPPFKTQIIIENETPQPPLTEGEIARVRREEKAIDAIQDAGFAIVPNHLTDDMRRSIWTSQAKEAAERVGETDESVRIFVERRMGDEQQAGIDRRAYQAMLTAHQEEGKGSGNER